MSSVVLNEVLLICCDADTSSELDSNKLFNCNGYDMKISLTKRDFIVLASPCICAIGAAIEFLPADLAIAVTICTLLMFFLFYFVLEGRRHTSQIISQNHMHYKELCSDNLNHFRQVEALIGLYEILSPIKIFPPTRSWSASPDVLALIANSVIELTNKTKEPFVVEASSGISTLVTAYCLSKSNRGKVLSLEHDKFYAQKTRDLIKEHGLEKYAQIVYAPLVKHEIEEQEFLWYEMKDINREDSIDLVIIDGPPAHPNTESRYPCLPLLYEILSKEAVLILDDANREGEQKILKKWTESYPEFEVEMLEFEKGAALLTRA